MMWKVITKVPPAEIKLGSEPTLDDSGAYKFTVGDPEGQVEYWRVPSSNVAMIIFLPHEDFRL